MANNEFSTCLEDWEDLEKEYVQLEVCSYDFESTCADVVLPIHSLFSNSYEGNTNSKALSLRRYNGSL